MAGLLSHSCTADCWTALTILSLPCRYDGETFVKPPEVLTRDRLLGMYEVGWVVGGQVVQQKSVMRGVDLESALGMYRWGWGKV